MYNDADMGTVSTSDWPLHSCYSFLTVAQKSVLEFAAVAVVERKH